MTQLLLDPHGQPVSSSRFVPQWRQAAKAAGAPKLRYHDLRHTYASTLLSGGANIKAVSGYLGHASPVVTLNTYAHLMPADDDITRRVLAAAFARADQATPADQARTS